jgi:rod shape-determining protein MreB
MDEAIAKYVKTRFGMIIGESTAEQLKISLGSAVDAGSNASMEVRGRDAETGLPKSISVGAASIREAIAGPVGRIVDTVRSVLGKTPPELAADIIGEGIVLSGGGSLLPGINRLIARVTGMPVRRAENPLEAVALGAGLAMEDTENDIGEHEASASVEI